MTRRQFYKLLETPKIQKLHWGLVKRPDRKLIRATTLRTSLFVYRSRLCCPITAIENEEAQFIVQCGQKLGLSTEDIKAIADAADDKGHASIRRALMRRLIKTENFLEYL